MSTGLDINGDENAILGKVKAERARVFNERMVGGAMASLFGTLLLAWTQVAVAGWIRAIAWLCCINVIEILIIVIGYRYRAQLTDARAWYWTRLQIACSFLLGIAWGVSIWFFWIDGQILSYVVNLTILVTVTALTLSIVSPLSIATLLFSLGILSPPLLHLVVVNNPVGPQVFAGLVILFLVQFRYAGIERQQLTAGLDGAIRNAALAQRLKISEERYRVLAENSHDVIWTIDIGSGRFSYVSPSVLRQRGYTPEEVLAQSTEATLTLESAKLAGKALREMRDAIIAGDRTQLSKTMEVDQPHRDGHIVNAEIVATFILDDVGYPVAILGITRDITERKKSQRELERLSQTDVLTGLANRRHFMKLANQELSRTRRFGGPLSVFMLDIDYFKKVNDTYGHQAGDLVLQRLGDLCRQVLRDIDCIGRIGGEEFAVMLPQTSGDTAFVVAERLRQAIASVDVLLPQGLAIKFTVSIGVAALAENITTMDALIALADRALYESKGTGRNRVTLQATSQAAPKN